MQGMKCGKYAQFLMNLIWGGCLLVTSSAWARLDAVPGARYPSARAAAMGDAYLPLGEDGASALFVNPAIIGKSRDANFTPLDLQFNGSLGYLSLFSLSPLNFYQVTSLSSFLPSLQRSPGTYSGVGASVTPTFMTRGFAFGLMMNTELAGQVNTDGSVNYKSLYQLVPAIGTGVKLASGVVRIGYSLQWVHQASGAVNNLPATTSPLGYNQSLGQGSGFSHTIGFALSIPQRYIPSLNLVARNVLGTTFAGSSIYPFASNASGSPAREPMTLDASISIQPKTGNGGYVNLVLVYRDMTNTSGISIIGRLAAGLEFSFRDAIYLRGGFGSGYPSAGVGLRKKGGEFSATWANVEVGSGYLVQKDTRFMLQYQIRAF